MYYVRTVKSGVQAMHRQGFYLEIFEKPHHKTISLLTLPRLHDQYLFHSTSPKTHPKNHIAISPLRRSLIEYHYVESRHNNSLRLRSR